jgi:uncharacterized membrane protein YjfL (UPF0719 family)
MIPAHRETNIGKSTSPIRDAITANQDLVVVFKWGGWALVIFFVGLIILAYFMVAKRKEKVVHVDTTAGDEGED